MNNRDKKRPLRLLKRFFKERIRLGPVFRDERAGYLLMRGTLRRAAAHRRKRAA